MGVLTEYLKAEADHLKAEEGRREQAVQEWLTAISRLNEQLKQWLAEADSGKGLLAVSDSRASLSESGLGAYETNALRISIGGTRAAFVYPRARHVAATIRPPDKQPRRADGMVEIKDMFVAEYYLFRLKTDAGDDWYIQSVARWNLDETGRQVEPLNRERFEAALLSILK